MRTAKKRLFSVAVLLSMSLSGLSSFSAVALSPLPGSTAYAPISMEDVRSLASTRLNNAIAAGRLNKEEAARFRSELNNASSLSSVEETWANLEAAAQVAKAQHVSIDHMMTMFQRYINSLLMRHIVTKENSKLYVDRIEGVRRLKKQFYANDHFYDFWEFCVLAIDLNSEKERFARALAGYRPPLETLNELILRCDNYVGYNEVVSRQLSTFKSFEVEPDELQTSKYYFHQILLDKAHSRLQTKEVTDQLYGRLFRHQYTAGKVRITEADLDVAIKEVQRLIESGAANGHLTAAEEVRLQHELELIKELKKAYPGPNPGIDPVEKELRAEEVRYMAIDLRFLQDWLGRSLRKDGETIEAREEVLRAVRRIDLAEFSGRIRREDALSLLSDVNEAIQTATSDAQIITKCKIIEGRMDMMVADYSLVPAKTKMRLNSLQPVLAELTLDKGSAVAERERIAQYAATANSLDAPHQFGVNLVASSEIELLRTRINNLLKTQNASNDKVDYSPLNNQK